MGIEVRHDINPGMIPFQLGYADFLEGMRRQQQAAVGGNTPLQASAEATNARLRGQTANLGARQLARRTGQLPPDPSTDAGFNWDGVQNGGNVLGQWSATPEPTLQAGPQLAGSDQAAAVAESQRDYQPYNWEQDKAARVASVDQNKALQKSEELARYKDELTATRQRQNDERTRGEQLDAQYTKDMDAHRAGADQLSTLEPGAQTLLDAGANKDPYADQGTEFTPWQERQRQTHLDVIAKSMSNDDLSPQVRAKAIKQAMDSLEKIKPIQPKKPPAHQFQYTQNDDGSETEIDTQTGKKHTIAPAKGDKTLSPHDLEVIREKVESEDKFSGAPDDVIVAEIARRAQLGQMARDMIKNKAPVGMQKEPGVGRMRQNSEIQPNVPTDVPPAPAITPQVAQAAAAAPPHVAALQAVPLERLSDADKQQISEAVAYLKAQGTPPDEIAKQIAFMVNGGGQ